MSRIKVLFVIDTLEIGGTEKSLLDILPRLQNCEPVMLSLFPGDTLKKEFESRNVRCVSLHRASEYNLFNFLPIIRIIKQEQPDVIVGSLFWGEFYTRLACLFRRTPLIGTFVNDSYSPERYSRMNMTASLKLRLYQFLDRVTAVMCARFIANSNAIRISNAKALGIALDKIEVVYRGRNVMQFERRYDVKYSDAFSFVTVGRLIERKGHRELLQAMAVVIKRYPLATLSIIGDGDERPKLESLISSLGLTKNVVLCGAVPNAAAVLYDHHAFVFTSHYEGFSGAIVEALLVGIPLIASDIAVSREAVNAGDCRLYPVADVGALAAQMVWSIDNREASLRMAERARQSAREKFNIEVVCDQYSSVIAQTLLSSPNKKHASR